MVRSFTPSVAQRKRRRVSQLARLLFSPIGDGEAAATRAAIQRDIKGLGLDHHAIGDALELGLEQLDRADVVDDEDADLPDDAECRMLIDDLLGEFPDRLSPWELAFLDAISGQQTISTKQKAKLLQIAQQVPRRRRAAR
jgi:hypothetical protein